MKKISLVAAAAFALGALFGASNYSLIVGENDMGFMKKAEMTLAHPYYDTRSWGALDYLKHPDVAAWVARKKLKKIASAAKELKETIKEGAKESYQDVKENVLDAKEGIKEGAKEVGEAAKEQYQEVKEKVSNAVNGEGEEGEQPVQATDEPVSPQ